MEGAEGMGKACDAGGARGLARLLSRDSSLVPQERAEISQQKALIRAASVGSVSDLECLYLQLVELFLSRRWWCSQCSVEILKQLLDVLGM